eukprot:gene14015-18796_t
MKTSVQYLIYFAIYFLLLACANNTKKSPNISPEAKLQQISDLAAKSKGNVITLDDSTYAYYAVTKPRPYTLIVFLTAAHPKFKCTICKQIDNELTLVAESYAAESKTRTDGEKVFFLRLDYESSQKVFQNYAINSVPLLFHIPPYVGSEKIEGKEYEISARDKYQVPQDPDAESMVQFLRDRTGVSVTIKRSMIGTYILVLVIFGIIAALVPPIINSLPFWLKIIQAKPLWLIVSAGVYTCAISGLIFDIIRSPQMYYANPQTGQIMFFYPQSGNQFVVEGFVIGFLNLACAGALIFVATVAPNFKDEQARTVAMLTGICIFGVCFRMVRSLYIMKNNWYGSRF